MGRALVTDPSIVMADEPTGNLDMESAAMVLSALRRQTEEGRTVLVVSHNPSVIELSDREIDLARINRGPEERG